MPNAVRIRGLYASERVHVEEENKLNETAGNEKLKQE